MPVLASFDTDGTWGETWVCDDLISQRLGREGLVWGRWSVDLPATDAPERVLAVRADEIATLRERFGIETGDHVVRLTPDHADWPALRQHLLTEYTQVRTEVRGFLRGAGLLYVRTGDGFLGLLCEAGDWVALPAGTRHFFDAGDAPSCDVLRLTAAPGGGDTQPTGDPTPALPLLDAFVEEVLALMGSSVDED